MSFSLWMQPVPPSPPPVEYAGYHLKFPFRKHFYHDAERKGDPVLLTSSHVDWLTGIQDSDNSSAQELATEVRGLLAAIARYERVWVWIGDGEDGPLPNAIMAEEEDES